MFKRRLSHHCCAETGAANNLGEIVITTFISYQLIIGRLRRKYISLNLHRIQRPHLVHVRGAGQSSEKPPTISILPPATIPPFYSNNTNPSWGKSFISKPDNVVIRLGPSFGRWDCHNVMCSFGWLLVVHVTVHAGITPLCPLYCCNLECYGDKYLSELD